ncbi:MAG: hypothetical protein EOS28_31250 [Mesorhizobium sp.]|nr:MAG: hypothetical protein EOS28_31250 [Mesorhizobium sp.]
MAAVLLTSDNLDFVKTNLRQAVPQVKSSHLTEALAFGAGYRTHASLLVAMKSARLSQPLLGDVDWSLITSRLTAFGYVGVDLSSLDAITRAPGLPKRIWIEFRSGDIGSNNYWFRECRQREIPNIRIERRTKYVKLNWDCISIDPSREAHVQGEFGTALGREMFKAYQSIARRIPGKSEFVGSSFVGSVDHLLPEAAHEIADAFFAMLYTPMYEERLSA